MRGSAVRRILRTSVELLIVVCQAAVVRGGHATMASRSCRTWTPARMVSSPQLQSISCSHARWHRAEETEIAMSTPRLNSVPACNQSWRLWSTPSCTSHSSDDLVGLKRGLPMDTWLYEQ